MASPMRLRCHVLPCVDGCGESSCLPVDLVVLDVRVLHNDRLLKISSAAVCLVFFQSRWEISSYFPDVDFATLTRDTVYTPALLLGSGLFLWVWRSPTGHRFLHQRYLATPTTDRRIFYIQSQTTQPRLRDLLHTMSTTLTPPPLCLLTTDSVQ